MQTSRIAAPLLALALLTGACSSSGSESSDPPADDGGADPGPAPAPSPEAPEDAPSDADLVQPDPVDDPVLDVGLDDIAGAPGELPMPRGLRVRVAPAEVGARLDVVVDGDDLLSDCIAEGLDPSAGDHALRLLINAEATALDGTPVVVEAVAEVALPPDVAGNGLEYAGDAVVTGFDRAGFAERASEIIDGDGTTPSTSIRFSLSGSADDPTVQLLVGDEAYDPTALEVRTEVRGPGDERSCERLGPLDLPQVLQTPEGPVVFDTATTLPYQDD